MVEIIREGLTFDDVLLVPHHSEIESRSLIDLSVKWGALEFKHPIIPANMKTVTGIEMAREIIKGGGLAILHRFMDLQEQLDAAEDIIDNFGSKNLAISIGVKKNDAEAVPQFIERGVKMFCIDIAHGDSKKCVEMISWIKKNYPEMFLIAGNVATGSGARNLWNAGANVVKIGVGPGSICSTRIETGNGVPQLTALMDVAQAQKEMIELYKTKDKKINPDEHITRHFPFIADGGVQSAGDLVKALCFADMVMVGNLFAGCEETPGKTMILDGVPHKEYVGSSTHKTNHIEGVSALVPCKGKFDDVLQKLLEGLRSGCSYQGAANLKELKEEPCFMKITASGLRESHPHDVIIR